MATPEPFPHIVLVGCGAMGSALLTGWLACPQLHKISVIEPCAQTVAPFLKDGRVAWHSSPEELTCFPDLFVFAVKPFLLETVLPLYASFDTLMVSVAAGKSLGFYENFLPKHSFVRAMPNLPVSCGQGVIGLLANGRVSPAHRQMAIACFSPLGFCQWVASDEEMDKLTAISGSGPAYVFFLIEALAKGAESLGFDPKVALELATQTFLGAATCAQTSSELPATLRHRVTTPQGTTAAALQVLEAAGLPDVMREAVRAAFRRAQELST